MDVSSLDGVGKYLTEKYDGIDVFISRIRFDGKIPPGAVPDPNAPNECIIAYSSRCTHLGCDLVEESPIDTPDGPKPREFERYADGFVKCGCKCHLSTFDLETGVPINAPATACLPQVELSGDLNTVEFVGWMGNKTPASVPYGVPFGHVLIDINNV